VVEAAGFFRSDTPERLDLYLHGASLLPASAVFRLLRIAAKRGFREAAGFATMLSKLLIVQTWRRQVAARGKIRKNGQPE
jgi:hypothetical protein